MSGRQEIKSGYYSGFFLKGEIHLQTKYRPMTKIYGFFWSFLGRTCSIWTFPGWRLNRSCSCWPAPQPQQCWILNLLRQGSRLHSHGYQSDSFLLGHNRHSCPLFLMVLFNMKTRVILLKYVRSCHSFQILPKASRLKEKAKILSVI